MLVASSSAADFGAHRIMQALPLMSLAPLAKVVIDALPLGEVFRQHPPLNAADHDVENGIDDLTHFKFARSPVSFSNGEQLFDMLPLAVSQITRIVFVRHNSNIPN